jgi:tRNA A-37 threonylcarbamoyl transferase component Bud32/Ca2+-binding EF-hand superfamily protein
MGGLSIVCKGTEEEKFTFLFSMYDLRGDGYIDKAELVSMVFTIQLHNLSDSVTTLTSFSNSSRRPSKIHDQSDLFISLKPGSNPIKSSRSSRFLEVQNIAASILEQFGLGENGKLNYEEFKIFLQNYPELMNKFSSSFQQEAWSPRESRRRRSTPQDSMFKTKRKVDSPLIHPTEIEMQGLVYKNVKDSEKIQKLYAVLKGNLLMFFENRSDRLPYGVVFLDGVCVEKLQSYQEFKYGFALSHSNESYDYAYIWCEDKDTCSSWISKLEQAARFKKFKHHYHLEKKIGQGKFSEVYLASEFSSGLKYAVKVIDKTKLKKSEKELIRSEIAIMKILDHPGVISMKEIFDTKKHILILMEYVKGGELLNLICTKERFSEYSINKIIAQLLDTVRYIHDVGIVHRDIKPENILCVDDSDIPEIKLADFGLSKLVSPNDTLTLACGTLSYVAPEVLKQEGYDKKADIWSIGVIAYLLLRGKLPFEDIDKNTIIDLTLNSTPDFSDSWCNRYTSQAIGFVKFLLEKEPKLRPTAEEALDHAWIRVNSITECRYNNS